MRPSIPHLLLLIALATVALAALYPRDVESFSLPKAPRLERRRGGGSAGRGGGGGGGGGRSSSSGGSSSSSGSASRFVPSTFFSSSSSSSSSGSNKSKCSKQSSGGGDGASGKRGSTVVAPMMIGNSLGGGGGSGGGYKNAKNQTNANSTWPSRDLSKQISQALPSVTNPFSRLLRMLKHNSSKTSKKTETIKRRIVEDTGLMLMKRSPVPETKGGGGGRGRNGGRGQSRLGSKAQSAKSPSSNTGGFSKSGSGTPKSFGSGSSRSYAGGSSVPYTAGKSSPSGIAPLALSVGAIALIFPGMWLYGAYAYNYPHSPYKRSSNDTIPIICVCQQYSVCGCDENYNETFIEDMYRNATDKGEPKLARISDVNGTKTLVVNGTLENGTTAASGSTSGAGRGIEYWSGWWSTIAIVIFMCNM